MSVIRLVSFSLFVISILSSRVEARKVGLSYRMPDTSHLSRDFFGQTYLQVKAYHENNKDESQALLSAGIMVNPCDKNEAITLKGYADNPSFKLTLNDFSCDEDYRVSFYTNIGNKSAVKVSSLEVVRTRSLSADESGNVILEFIQTPVAVKLWQNRRKNQISLSPK